MIPSQVSRQRDFTGGEIDESAMRRDDVQLVRASSRRMSNKLMVATGACDQRPGRQALFASNDERTDDISVDGTVFRFCFGNGQLRIRDSEGTVLLNQTGMPWTSAAISRPIWALYDKSVVITHPSMTPRVVTWDGSTWSGADFAFQVTTSGQKRCPFYRLAATGITMQPSGVSGTINVTFSDDVLVNGHVGTRFRFHGRQLTIASVSGPTSGTATVNERLFISQRLRTTIAPDQQFLIGEVVTQDTTGAAGLITAANIAAYEVTAAAVAAGGSGYAVGDIVQVDGGTADTPARLEVATEAAGVITGFTVSTAGEYTVQPANPVTLTTITGSGTGATSNLTFSTNSNTLIVQLTSQIKFLVGDLIGPSGTATISKVTDLSPAASPVWDEELINDFRGWPFSVASDQRRLIFCDIPALRAGISWSAIDNPIDHFPGADPDDAIFEIVPGPERVLNLVPGSDEFVFTTKRVYYIPISEANPLRPGSVAFRKIDGPVAGLFRPIDTPLGTLYFSVGRKQILAIVGTGQTAQPYIIREIATYHAHLLSSPIVMAVSGGTPQIGEKYLYVVNSDGTVAVGRTEQGRDWIGFVPWTVASGGVTWISTLDFTVTFTTRYEYNPGSRRLVEQLDTAAWLDGQVLVNDVPAVLASGGGPGPLWFYAGATVHLMDGRKYYGTRLVDADGNIVLQEGDDWSSPTLIAGFAWTETLTPFIPHAGEGRSVHQTMRKRRVAEYAVTVQNNATGFTAGGKRIPPYRAGEDEGAEPPLREETHTFKKLGRSSDPQLPIVKDIPGPLRIIEFAADTGV